MNEYKKNAKETLKWVNRVRAAHGQRRLRRLPQGKCNWNTECPIARALAPCSDGVISVHASYIRSSDEAFRASLANMNLRRTGDLIDIPQYATQFVIAFDQGQYPELVEGG